VPHDRHTFCSHLAMRGAAPAAIQALAGHESVTTTQRYMHLAPVVLRETVRLLDGRGGTVRDETESAELRQTDGKTCDQAAANREIPFDIE
jgi:hypothetical protein